MTTPTPTDETTTTTTTAAVDDATEVAALVDTYLAAFSADDAERADLVARAWSPHGHFADPLFVATGHDELIALAATVPEMYPGHRFVRTSGIDLHHAHARYSWEFQDAAGAAVIEGTDVAQIGTDGRLVRVIGFFGPVPEA